MEIYDKYKEKNYLKKFRLQQICLKNYKKINLKIQGLQSKIRNLCFKNSKNFNLIFHLYMILEILLY